MKVLFALFACALLFVLCWPLAVFAMLAVPIVCLIVIPLMLLAIVVAAVLALVKTVVFLPVHLLGF